VDVGLKNLCIVTGHGRDYIEAEVDHIRQAFIKDSLEIECRYNRHYAKMNNCYSLLMGLPDKAETLVIINSDDVFDSRILDSIANGDTTELVVDNVKQLTSESMKVRIEEDTITRIGKWLEPKLSGGEYIGLARIAANDMALLRQSLQRVVEKNPGGFYEHAFDIMVDQTAIKPCNTDGLRWTEVDNYEDLIYTRELVRKELIS